MLVLNSRTEVVAVKRDHTRLFLSQHSPRDPLSFSAPGDDTLLIPRKSAESFLLRHKIDPAEVTLIQASWTTKLHL